MLMLVVKRFYSFLNTSHQNKLKLIFEEVKKTFIEKEFKLNAVSTKNSIKRLNPLLKKLLKLM